MPRLIGLRTSPWTEKARFALDIAGVAYAYTEHTPLLGEVGLAALARRAPSRVSVPMLLRDDGPPLTDSYDIARHAHLIGQGDLFPPGLELECAQWNQRSERAMRAGRAIAMRKLAIDRRATRAQLPGFLPAATHDLMTPVAALGVRHIIRKYDVDALHDAAAMDQMSDAFDALREALGDRPYILGDHLTYADITMTAPLCFVTPPLALGYSEDIARPYTHDALSARYPDLLAWRDRIYAAHRM